MDKSEDDNLMYYDLEGAGTYSGYTKIGDRYCQGKMVISDSIYFYVDDKLVYKFDEEVANEL